MKILLSFIFGWVLQILALAFGRSQPSRRQSPADWLPGPTSNGDDVLTVPVSQPKRSSARPSKRYGSLRLVSQEAIIHSTTERARRAKHRQAMKSPKRILRMARTAHTVSKNQRGATIQKIRPQSSWEAASGERRYKAEEKERIAAERRREEEERARREKARFEAPAARPRFNFSLY